MAPEELAEFGRLCGWTLARALARFAVAYADQNERDHAALLDAIRTGRVTARTEL